MTGGGSNRFSWCITNSLKARDYKVPSTFGILIIPGIHWIWLSPCLKMKLLHVTCVSTWLAHSDHLLLLCSFYSFLGGFVQCQNMCIFLSHYPPYLSFSFGPPPKPFPIISLCRIISWLGVLCPAKSLPVRIVEKWLMLHFSCGALQIQKICSPSSFWDSRKKNKSQ